MFSSDYNPVVSRAQAHTHTRAAHARPYGFTIPNFQTVSKKPCPPPRARRIQTRRSGVHGKGVFAVQDIAEGETLIEYVGEIITWQEAQDRHPHDPANPNHTFYFHVDEDRVIDALHGGNSSRWINHSCDPNCEADEVDGRIFIKALRNIRAGEELNYDYGLVIDERYTPKLKAEYPCWCGSCQLPRHPAGAQATPGHDPKARPGKAGR